MYTLHMHEALKGIAGIVLLALVVGGAYYMYTLWSGANPLFGGPGPDTKALASSFGSLVSSTDTTVTIKLQDGSQTSFPISPLTKVVSTVAEGETAKELSDLPVGSMLLVVPGAGDSGAASVQVLSLTPPPSFAAGEIPVSINGVVVEREGAQLVLSLKDGGQQRVWVTNKTRILSNVPAGQKGMSFSSLETGAQVFVSGSKDLEGVLIAYTLQMLSATPGVAR